MYLRGFTFYVRWYEPDQGRLISRPTGFRTDVMGFDPAKDAAHALLDRIQEEIHSGTPIRDAPLTTRSLLPFAMRWDVPEFTYMMECPLCKRVKIGYSSNVWHREHGNRRQHGIRFDCHPNELMVLLRWPGGGVRLESHWHHLFRARRIGRSEWFLSLTDDERKIVESAARRVTVATTHAGAITYDR